MLTKESVELFIIIQITAGRLENCGFCRDSSQSCAKRGGGIHIISPGREHKKDVLFSALANKALGSSFHLAKCLYLSQLTMVTGYTHASERERKTLYIPRQRRNNGKATPQLRELRIFAATKMKHVPTIRYCININYCGHLGE